jgi:hypothetical protein
MPNVANTAQSTSYARLPLQFSMTLQRQRRAKRTFAVVTACLKEAGQGVRGISVRFLGGSTARNARRITSARTNARGCAKARIRVRRRTMVVVAAIPTLPARQVAGCRPTLAPRCSAASTALAFGLVRVGRVRR